MKPLQHAKASARRFGGSWRDYIEVRNFIDSSKATFATSGHRAILHNELGPALGTWIYGDALRNSDAALVPVAAIITAHLEEDVGRMPTLDDWLAGRPERPQSRRIRALPPRIEAMSGDPCRTVAGLFGTRPDEYAAAVSFFGLCDRFSRRGPCGQAEAQIDRSGRQAFPSSLDD